ncbi:TcpE family conjugal transfer membrane protein [Streptomonospora alba]|uniref:TcpE family conjugal transfer membrane protein n=1 Tax=Streptomonospora alba TaxID=183763 RepID=UPI00069ACD43|nr:TcpE family conjugal transfer membrane protein [Streptomonospora alba]
MDLPTYTNIWRIEKKLYKLYDFRLPQPVSVVYIGVLVGVAFVWVMLLQLIGVPAEMPLHVIYIVPPFVIAFLATRPVVEGKRLSELISSQARYLAEPKAFTRLRPERESGTVAVTVRVWHRDPRAGPLPEATGAAAARGRTRAADPEEVDRERVGEDEEQPSRRAAVDVPRRTADQAPPLAEALPTARPPDERAPTVEEVEEYATDPLWGGDAPVRTGVPSNGSAPDPVPDPGAWADGRRPEHSAPEDERETEAAVGPDPAALGVRSAEPAEDDVPAEAHPATAPASAAEAAPPDLRREWEWDYDRDGDRGEKPKRGVGLRILNYFGFALDKAPLQAADAQEAQGDSERGSRARPVTGPIPGAARTPADLAERLAVAESPALSDDERSRAAADSERAVAAAEPPAAVDRHAARDAAAARRRAEEMMAAPMPAEREHGTASGAADAEPGAAETEQPASARGGAAAPVPGPQRRLRGRAQGMEVARRLERTRSDESAPAESAQAAAPAAPAGSEAVAGAERARERVPAPQTAEPGRAAGEAEPTGRPSLRERWAQRRPHSAPWDLPVPLDSADSDAHADDAEAQAGERRDGAAATGSDVGAAASSTGSGASAKPPLQLDHGTDEHESLSGVVRVFFAQSDHTGPGTERTGERAQHGADRTEAGAGRSPGGGAEHPSSPEADSSGTDEPPEAGAGPDTPPERPAPGKPSLQLDHGTGEHEDMSQVVRVFSAASGRTDEPTERRDDADAAPNDGSAGDAARPAAASGASGATDPAESGRPATAVAAEPVAAEAEAGADGTPEETASGSTGTTGAGGAEAAPAAAGGSAGDGAQEEAAAESADQRTAQSSERSNEGSRNADDQLAVLDRYLGHTDTPPPPQPRFAEAGGHEPRRPVAWFTDAPAPAGEAERTASAGSAAPAAEGRADRADAREGVEPDASASRPDEAGDPSDGGGASADSAESPTPRSEGDGAFEGERNERTPGATAHEAEPAVEQPADPPTAERRDEEGAQPVATQDRADEGGDRTADAGPDRSGPDADGARTGEGAETTAEGGGAAVGRQTLPPLAGPPVESGATPSLRGAGARQDGDRGTGLADDLADGGAEAPGTGSGGEPVESLPETRSAAPAAEDRPAGGAVSDEGDGRDAAARHSLPPLAGPPDEADRGVSARSAAPADSRSSGDGQGSAAGLAADGADREAPAAASAPDAGDDVPDDAPDEGDGAATSAATPGKPSLELDHGTGEHESFSRVDTPDRRSSPADLEAAEAAAIRARRNGGGRDESPRTDAAGEQLQDRSTTGAPAASAARSGSQPTGTDAAAESPDSTGSTDSPEGADRAEAAQRGDRSDRLSRTIRSSPTGGSPAVTAEPAGADAPGGTGASSSASGDRAHDARGATAGSTGNRRPVRSAPPAHIDDGVFARVAQNARRLSHLFGQTPPGTPPDPAPQAGDASDTSAPPATEDGAHTAERSFAASGPGAPADADKPELQLDHGTGEQQRMGGAPNGAPAPQARPADAARQESGGESGGTRGWRRLARVVTGGSQAAAKSDLPEGDIGRLRTPLPGPRNVVVLGCTGGAGQTATALMLGHTLAAYRDERVAAVDVNPGSGGLSRRIRSETPETVTSLLANADTVHTYAGMRRYTSRLQATGLEVVATLDDPYVQTLDDRDYAGLAALLERFYEVTVLDPAATGVARALPAADGMVLVAPASEDAARAVAMTFEWLDGHGYAALRSTSVVVINGVSKRSLADVDAAEQVARGRCRAIVRVPWDDHLAAGKVVDVGALRATTRRAQGALGGVLMRGLDGPANTGASGSGGPRRRPSETRR